MEVVALVVAGGGRPGWAAALTNSCHRVTTASTAASAMLAVCAESPDVVLIDAGRETTSTAELVRTLYSASASPILVLHNDPASMEAVYLLDAGADDVIPTNCEEPELSARIRAALRRRANQLQVDSLRGERSRGVPATAHDDREAQDWRHLFAALERKLITVDGLLTAAPAAEIPGNDTEGPAPAQPIRNGAEDALR